MNIYPHFRLLHRSRPRRLWTLELSFDAQRRAWNVPHGPPQHTHERHLVVELPGEADGEAFDCWDAGPTEIRKWTPDHIVVVLHGAKLRGCFSLVRFRHTGQPHWLWVRVRAGSHAARPAHTLCISSSS